jgi:hypothetical protein
MDVSKSAMESNRRRIMRGIVANATHFPAAVNFGHFDAAIPTIRNLSHAQASNSNREGRVRWLRRFGLAN